MAQTDLLLRKLRIILILSLIILTWVVSFYVTEAGIATLPKGVDLSAVMSGTGTIALAIFSMFLAFASIYGLSSIEAKIRAVVEEVTNKRLEKVENEARGRSFAILGYVIGENSVEPISLKPSNVERLKEAIYYCEQGYTFLKNTGLPVEFMALNNLLGYSCVLQDTSRRDFILEGAQRLRIAAQEHDSPNLLLTYARTIISFSRNSKEIETAHALVEDLNLNPRLNEKQKREAELLASLSPKNRKES